MTTAFPIAEAIPKLQPGVYVLAAYASAKKDDDGYRNAATQWFIVSDLGLTAINGDDGMHTFVRSLASAAPVANASVRLVARNNEVLGYSQDRQPRLRPLRCRPASAAKAAWRRPCWSPRRGDGDYAFLDLSTGAFDLTDRGVKGRTAPGPIDAFAYTDRGVYRAGEQVYLTALARDRTGKASGVPVTVIFSRPDGVEHARVTLTDQGQGGRTTTLALAGSAMTGTWRVKIHTDPKSGADRPGRVPGRGLRAGAPRPQARAGRAGALPAGARHHQARRPLSLRAAGRRPRRRGRDRREAGQGRSAGLRRLQVRPRRRAGGARAQAARGLPATDAEGKADIAVQLPALPKTNRPLEADVILKLREFGGRTIERTVTLPVDLKAPRIGIKPLFKGGQAEEGEPARFEAILLGDDGKAVEAKGLKWELMRLENRWQWYSRDGSWNFESQTSTRRVATGTADATPGTPAKIEAKVDWGRYRLEVSTADGSGLVISSVVFSAGYYADEAADSPEVLDVALDKPSYKAGETARVKIASRMAGRALIAVMSSGLASTQEVDLPAGGGEVPIRVSDDWNPGAYVTVMLYRPMDEKAKRMPSRALGLRWLAIDQAPRMLNVDLDAPEKVKSGSTLTVPVKVAGLAAGEEARITVAATDVGILNLTRFEPPKPAGLVLRPAPARHRDPRPLRPPDRRHARRARHAALRRRRLGRRHVGAGQPAGRGDARPVLGHRQGRRRRHRAGRVPDARLQRHGAPLGRGLERRQGRLGHQGRDRARSGGAHRLGPALPHAGRQGAPRTRRAQRRGHGRHLHRHRPVRAGGRCAVAPGFERAVALDAGERKREAFQLRTTEVGLTTLAVRVTGPNGIDVRRKPHVRREGAGRRHPPPHGEPAAGQGRQDHAQRDLFQDLIPRRSRPPSRSEPTASLDVPGILAALDRYPYGCAEQTTSRALPLLYVNDVAKRMGLATDAMLRERIDGAIERVFAMQDSSGAFGIWGPSDGDMWLTSYVTDFLTRAKEAGYAVRQQPFNQALDRLQNFISYAQDFENGGEGRAYALYVLARNGRAPIGELRYYVDTRLDRFSTPLAQAQLAAALSMLGDKPRAEKALQAALKTIADKDDGVTRRDYGTGVRDGAALITLASETGLAKTEVPRLVDVVAKAYRAKSYTSTQEQAWMLLAARALAEEAGNAAAHGQRRAAQGPAHPLAVAGRGQGRRADHLQRERCRGRCHGVGDRRGADARAGRLQGLHHRAHLLHARRQEGRPQERHRRARPSSSRTIGWSWCSRSTRPRRAAASSWSTGCRPASRSRTRGSSTPATSRRSTGSRPR